MMRDNRQVAINTQTEDVVPFRDDKQIPSAETQTSFQQKVSYSLPTGITWFLGAPMIIILPGMYAKYFGLTLTSIAMVLLISRLFDAVTDPVIGYLSDRYRKWSGTRKPLIILGAVGIVVGSYLLFVPPADVTVAYFLTCSLIFYLGWTLFEVPHLAWGGELATDYRDKTRIYTMRGFFTSLGPLLFFTIPLLGIFESKEFTPEMLKWSVLVCALLAIPMILLCIKTVPSGRVSDIDKQDSFRLLIDSILRNRPFLLFLVTYVVLGIGMGMWIGVTFIFIDAYLGLGEKMALAFTLGALAGIISIGLWYKLADWYGKKWAWGTGMAVGAIAMGGFAWLTPGEQSLIPLVTLMCAAYCAFAAMQTLTPSLLSDIVDYSTWKFGVDRGGTFFSVYLICTKANMSVGAGLGLGIAGWYGLDPSAAIHTEESLFGLFLSISYMPAFLFLASIILIMLMPIDARRHRIIQRRLAMRAHQTIRHAHV